MWVYIARRLLWLPFLLLAASFITFSLGRFGPGDPVEVILGPRYNPVVADRLRESLGLNRPYMVQYADYVWDFVHGDFGDSLRYRRPVGPLIGPKIWVSFSSSSRRDKAADVLRSPSILHTSAAMNSGRRFVPTTRT